MNPTIKNEQTKKHPIAILHQITQTDIVFQVVSVLFLLNTLVVAKVHIIVNKKPLFVERHSFLAVNALGFQYTEEIFSHSIVDTISTSWH